MRGWRGLLGYRGAGSMASRFGASMCGRGHRYSLVILTTLPQEVPENLHSIPYAAPWSAHWTQWPGCMQARKHFQRHMIPLQTIPANFQQSFGNPVKLTMQSQILLNPARNSYMLVWTTHASYIGVFIVIMEKMESTITGLYWESGK